MDKKSAGGFAIGVVLALGVGVCFGTAGTLSAVVGQRGFSVFQICFLQFSAAVVMLGILCAAKFHEPMSWRNIGILFALGAFYTFANLSYFLAIKVVSVAAAVAIQFQYVWMTVLVQSIADRKVPGKWTIISAVLIIFGTIFGSGLTDEIIAGEISMPFMGVVAAIACAVVYSLYIFFNDRIGVVANPIQTTLILNLGSLSSSTVLMFIFGGWTGFSFVAGIPWGFLLGVIAVILPIMALGVATDRIGGSLTAILASSELPAAVVMGYLLLSQQVTPLIVFGIVVILVAIALPTLDTRKPAESE